MPPPLVERGVNGAGIHKSQQGRQGYGACGVEISKLELDRGFCYVGKTKNGDPRGIHLPPHLVAALKEHPRGLDRPDQKLFRFRKNGRIYTLMNKVKKAAGLAELPGKFHIFRHTYARRPRRWRK